MNHQETIISNFEDVDLAYGGQIMSFTVQDVKWRKGNEENGF